MKIRRRKYASGKTGWQLDMGTVNGRRFQKLFPTKEKAEEHASELHGERRKYGESALAMTHEQRLRYAEAETKLAAAGVSIDEAVAWALERAGVPDEKPLGELLPLFLQAREREGKRERYIKHLGYSLRNFVRGREDRLPRSISKSDVEKWLFGNGWAPKSQQIYLGDLANFLRWALGKRRLNPCEDVKPAKAEQKEIEVLAPEQIERLFESAVFAK
jgi:hypothetical protein